MFGIGDYSYSIYKVAISGFYKNPLFALVYFKKTVMLDDTCYFLSFNDYETAYITMLILNNELVQEFIKSIALLNSKRPYTKKILERIDFYKILQYITIDDLYQTEINLGLPKKMTYEIYNTFQNLILYGENRQLNIFDWNN